MQELELSTQTQDQHLQEFLRFVRSEKLIEDEDRILVAVSGGLDSTVLAQLLARTRRLLKMHVEIVHVDHTQRGMMSAREGAWVKVLGERLAIPTHLISLNTEGSLSQAELRDLRRTALLKLAAEKNLSKIATAHHADDNAETFIMRAISGTGVSGLSGISPKESVWIRPLLWATRASLEDYARRYRLGWVEDPSNSRDVYLRNRIRNEVAPLLENIREGPISNLAVIAGRVSEEERDWDEWISAQFEEPVECLPRAWLEKWPTPLQRRIFKTWLKKLGLDPDPSLVEALLAGEELVHKEGSFLRRSDMYIFTPEKNFSSPWRNEPIPLELGKRIDLGRSTAWSFISDSPERFRAMDYSLFLVFRPPEAAAQKNGMKLSWNALPWPLVLRSRIQTDPSRELDRILAKHRIPRPFWKEWPLIVSRQDPKIIVAVLGIHVFDAFRLKNSGRCVCIESLFEERLKPNSVS